MLIVKKRYATSGYEYTLVVLRLTRVLAEVEGDRGEQYEDGYEPNATHHTPPALHSSGRPIHNRERCECDLILPQRHGNARAGQPTERQENSDARRTA
jgi:hypothetical protein